MKILVKTSVVALLVALAATTSASFTTQAVSPCGVQASLNDPDPSDCAFCGGNPAVHIRRLVDLERMNMAVFSAIAR